MNNQEIFLNLNCLKSIIRLETPETRSRLFNTKLNKSPAYIKLPLKFLYKYKIVSILSILVSAKEILKTYHKTNNIILKDNIISFYCTKNQNNAILRLFNVLGILDYRFARFSIKNAFMALIKVFGIALKKRKQLKYIGNKKLSFLIEALRFIFYYEYLKLTIKKYPEYSIVANDHSAQPLAFYSLCKQNNCKVVYLQHGHVSKYFPPLFRFDLSILFGQKSADIYLATGRGSKQIAFSGHNYKVAKKLSPCSQKMNVTIFPNIIYNKNIIKLITLLKENENIDNIYLKPHPLHLPDKNLSILIDSFSKTKILSANADFQKLTDLGIAANSSIHIELLSQGINTIYYDKLDEFEYDYYGFIKDKSVLAIKKIENLSAKTINEFYQSPKWRENITQFDFSFDSPESMKKEIAKIKLFFNTQCDLN